ATVDERRQTGLGVVADERADFGATGGNSLAADAHLDGAVVVAQIADLSSGGEIDPFAEVGMPEKAVVILVAEALQDSLLDFAADPAARPEAGAADLAADNPALPTDQAGPLDARKGLHDGAAIEHDGTAARVDHDHRLDGGAVGEEQSLRWTNDVHVFRASRPGSLLEPCRVRAQGGTVVLDEVPREVDQRA